MSKFNFKYHIVDTDLPTDHNYSQTALVDLTGDGNLEYVMGMQYGDLFAYQYHKGEWQKYRIGLSSPSDVGACILDVSGNGKPDIVTGGAWFENTGALDSPFIRHLFDAELTAVHDVAKADIDGDGRMEIITMSDRNSLRWYKIPADPAQPWERHDIGKPVHAGVALGDLNGNGYIDVVRTDVWFENVKGDGSAWIEHAIGPNTYPPDDFQPYFAFNATYAVICDMNQNGKNDIVFTDAEIPGGKVWWMENLDGKGLQWRRHEIYNWDPDVEPRRGAYHSLFVGDLDRDGDLDVFSCEMEGVGGDAPPRYYIWENVDGTGLAWQEHVILDENLGGHAAVIGDVTGNGLPDIIAKPWHVSAANALGGRMFVVFLENLG